VRLLHLVVRLLSQLTQAVSALEVGPRRDSLFPSFSHSRLLTRHLLDLPILLGDDEPGTKPDATAAAAAAVASDDDDGHFISAPPLEVEALPSFRPCLLRPASDHAVGQLLVSPVNASGIIRENNNNNDIQGG
jgi:hypothetical protein